MNTAIKALTARINHRCDACRRWAIKPGHRYARCTIFPGHNILGADKPYALKRCISCASERDDAADLTYKACGSYCCGLNPCARPVRHGGDCSCREDVLRAGNPRFTATATNPRSSGAGEHWRVDHPGIGVLAYDTESEARSAAGTAGTLIPPGGGER